MRRYLALVLFAAGLFAQGKPGGQDTCFANPNAPGCGHFPYARGPAERWVSPAPAKPLSNPSPRTEPASTRGTYTDNSHPFPGSNGNPTLHRIGAIDWRFAHPYPEMLMGINLGAIQNSPLAKALVAQIAHHEGLGEADVQRMFDALGDVEQVAVSVFANQMVIMITGNLASNAPPAPEPGMKYYVISGDAVLLGHEAAVDQAISRMGFPAFETPQIKHAKTLSGSYDFWACGSGALAGLVGGQKTFPGGIRHFEFGTALHDQLLVDVGFELGNPAELQRVAKRPPAPFGTVHFDGSMIHMRLAMTSAEAESRFAGFVAGPAGRTLGQLLAAAKNMPARSPSAPPRSRRPTIVGLEGGPREVGVVQDKQK